MRKDVESIRYPIVLPSRHPIVTKVIIQKHIDLLHAGVQTVMSALRENYWILKSRKTVRRVLSECIICKRFTVKPLTTLSPPLPEDRISLSSEDKTRIEETLSSGISRPVEEFSKSRKEDVIKEGDIVLIGDTNSKRIYWPLAKVIKLIPGRDGRVRVVEVSTSSGSFLRPIQRLYPLEVSETDISDLPEQIKETLKDRV
ncbi:uncharacterized protein TNCV_4337141 [Trichonephila clavipes]|nr:uncharacterized protein TNCV_4337141 [Trichonephila clavipes]